MMTARNWEADPCLCGHARAGHRKRRPTYPATVGTRGRCSGCACREFDIDAVELDHAEAIAMEGRRQGARDFMAEMGWAR